tara:strand:+ start:2143 stop:2262 length:120 start_codon:yes stop_codon:yes gene_type:complete
MLKQKNYFTKLENALKKNLKKRKKFQNIIKKKKKNRLQK